MTGAAQGLSRAISTLTYEEAEAAMEAAEEALYDKYGDGVFPLDELDRLFRLFLAAGAAMAPPSSLQ